METNDKLLPTQVEWLVNDLAAADRAWKIVMIHNSLYSPGKYGARRPVCNAALSLRKQLNGIFAAYGVDMVLAVTIMCSANPTHPCKLDRADRL